MSWEHFYTKHLFAMVRKSMWHIEWGLFLCTAGESKQFVGFITVSRAGGLFVSQGQQFASCKTVPLAAATRACSGGPCTGPFVDTFSFSLQSP